MKKNILFMMINMNIGGTEKALLNMIDEIDNTKYNVTILMLEKYGGFLDYIPSWVNIKYIDEYKDLKPLYNNPPMKSAIKLIKQGKLTKGLTIGVSHLIYKITNDRSIYFRYLLKECKNIEEDYDVAIAYAGPMDLISYYIINKVKAEEKIQWVHFDVTKIGINKFFAEKLYSKFDKIYVVSAEAKNKLDNLIPSLASKTEVFHNIVPKNKIIKMAEEGQGFEDEFDGIRILTVGRLSHEKGQDMVIPIVSKLKLEGYPIRWYLIGDGNLRNECEKLIKKYNVEDECVLLGTKLNPYTYMKECDIYVQPSRYEGYCVTTMEVKVFEKYMVVTDVNGIKEQINNNKKGLIVDISEDDIYENVKKIINNKILVNEAKCN